MAATYQEHIPSPRLLDYVECFWSLEATSDAPQLVVPDGCMDILMRFGRTAYTVDVVGSMTRSERAVIRAGESFLGIRFKPGRLPLLADIDCASLVNRTNSFRDSRSYKVGETLLRVGRDCCIEEKIELLERALVVSSDPLSGHLAIDVLVASEGSTSAAELADLANLSERQLRRQFINLTGLPPKLLARVLRFRKAYGALQSKSAMGLAAIAIDCGYTDQAHFSHEFKEFVGCTPTSWQSQHGDVRFLQDGA